MRSPSPPRPDPTRSLQVVEIKGGQVVTIHNCLNTELLPEFGLPLHLKSED